MILDTFDQLGALYAPTAVGANINTGAVLDLLAGNDPGPGMDIEFLIQCMTTPASGGAATLDFQLLGNLTDPNFGSGNVVLADSVANGVAAPAYTTITAGWRFQGVIPRQILTTAYEKKTAFVRYLAFCVNIGTAVLTAGAFSCWLSNGKQQANIAYPANYTV